MTKRFIFFIIFLVLIDVFISLSINADLLSYQERLAAVQERLIKLEKENNQLKGELAQLSSLNRIAQLASEMGLTQNDQRLVVISQDQFALR